MRECDSKLGLRLRQHAYKGVGLYCSHLALTNVSVGADNSGAGSNAARFAVFDGPPPVTVERQCVTEVLTDCMLLGALCVPINDCVLLRYCCVLHSLLNKS